MNETVCFNFMGGTDDTTAESGLLHGPDLFVKACSWLLFEGVLKAQELEDRVVDKGHGLSATRRTEHMKLQTVELEGPKES